MFRQGPRREEQALMWRISQGAIAAAGTRRGRAALFSLLACALVLLVGLAASSDAAKVGRTTVILGQTSTEPDPSCPELPCQAVGSVTGFQVSNGQTQAALPRHPRRQDHLLDADPGAADRQPADLLQRLLRHPAAGPPGDPPPRPRHQPAALQPAATGLGPGPQPLPGEDGQVRRQPQGRKGRHRRDHGPDLGRGLRPGPEREQRLARQPRARSVQKRHRHPPG